MRTRVWLPETHPVLKLPPIGLAGHYIVDVIHAQTGEVKQHLEFQNLLTDGLMNAIGNGSVSLENAFDYAEVGTGSAPPQTTDTTLQSSFGSRTIFNGGIARVTLNNTSPEYTYRRITRVFTESQVNGNLTEVGFWNHPTAGILTNRSLFKDSAGNPTTVLKTSADILRIQYEYRLYAPLFDVTDTISIAGTPTTYTIRPQRVQSLAGWSILLDDIGAWNPFSRVHDSDTLQIRTGQNDVTPFDVASSSLAPYVAGTFYRDMTITVDSTIGNYVSGFGLFTYNAFRDGIGPVLWQVGLSPRVIKTNNQQFTLTLRQAWSRV
jgi:hypothetical protein